MAEQSQAEKTPESSKNPHTTVKDKEFQKKLEDSQTIAAKIAKVKVRNELEKERWPLRDLSADEVYNVAHLENTLVNNSKAEGKEKINPTTEKVLKESIESFWNNAQRQLDQFRRPDSVNPEKETELRNAEQRINEGLAVELAMALGKAGAASQEISAVDLSEEAGAASQEISAVDLIKESPIVEDEDFKGKVVVITGVAGGIGSVLAEEYCKMGSIVYAIDNRSQELHDVVSKIQAKNPNFQIKEIPADVSRPDQWVRQLDEAPHIDILLNNAAITDPKLRPEDPSSVPPTVAQNVELTREIGGWEKIRSDFTTTINADLVGPYLLMLYSTERALANGTDLVCVNTASTNLDTLKSNRSAYISAKSALITLTELFAQEFAWDKFRYNIVSPGATNTPLLENPEEAIKNLPLGLSEPIDVFYTTKYLTSKMSRRTTGANIRVDGARVAAERKKKPLK